MNPSSSARWRLPAEPALDHFCTGLIMATSVGLGLWAFEWALAWGWGLKGPEWVEAVATALTSVAATSAGTAAGTSAATSVSTPVILSSWSASHPLWRIDIFFWAMALGLLALALATRRALRHATFARAWELHRISSNDEASTTPGPWAWWPLDEQGAPGPVRSGDLQVRLDLGPWLLLQARGRRPRSHPLMRVISPSDWMLVRPRQLGVQGAEGHRLRSALFSS